MARAISAKTIFAVLTVAFLSTTALPSQAKAEACPRWQTATGPTGITLTLCMDGKYSSCVRDSRRLGWHESHVQERCNRLRAEGKVK
jgi:hypothetical protein